MHDWELVTNQRFAAIFPEQVTIAESAILTHAEPA
jgi:hypothetical protein